MSSPATAVSSPPSVRARYVYAYSFDRETFRGRYTTRHEALDAAHAALAAYPAIPEAIYVGRRINPAFDVGGLGDLLIEVICDRAIASGEAPLDAEALDDDVHADLDSQIAAALRDWLHRHELIPAGRIEEISEHPLPLVAHVAEGDEREVGLIGVEG